jgi:hypothetical protein
MSVYESPALEPFCFQQVFYDKRIMGNIFFGFIRMFSFEKDQTACLIRKWSSFIINQAKLMPVMGVIRGHGMYFFVLIGTHQIKIGVGVHILLGVVHFLNLTDDLILSNEIDQDDLENRQAIKGL